MFGLRTLAFALVFASMNACMKSPWSTDPKVRTLEDVGSVDFIVKEAEVHLYERVTLIGPVSSLPFMISSVNFDRDNAVAYLTGFPVDPLDPNSYWPMHETCTLSQKLTNTEVNSIQAEFRSVRLCRVSAPPGTAIPLVYIMNNGTIRSYENAIHASPPGYSDGAVDICDFKQLASVGRSVLNRIDLSKPMSCTPVEVNPLSE